MVFANRVFILLIIGLCGSSFELKFFYNMSSITSSTTTYRFINKERALQNTCKAILFCALAGISTRLSAQTPGPFEQAAAPPPGFSTANSTTPSALGVGRVKAPDGWGEFRYCDPNGTPGTKGLIVTREICNPNAVGIGPWNNDWVFDPSHTFGTGGGGGGPVEPKLGRVPVSIALGTIPFSYYSPLNPSVTHAPSPVLYLRSFQQPIFQARTVEYPGAFSTGSLKSRFIVMPDGNSGFNTEDPRAALDVQDANIANTPVAIFGNVLPYQLTGLPARMNAGGAPINQTYTRHIAIVPRLGLMGYNGISKAEDIGIVFTNGLGFNGADSNGALVIAPHTNSINAGGLRMEHNGNTELRGNFRCTKLTVNAKWWPDAVFAPGYRLMSLAQVDSFIQTNRHLPGVPCEDSVVNNGQDVGALQVIQQQKIEELTLYAIDQEKQLKAQQQLISEQKKQLAAQELRLQKLEALLHQK